MPKLPNMKLDILALAAHPDDVELSCSGTLIKHIKAGLKVGIADLTQGELGTRGTIETRKQEAEDSAKIMGLAGRWNLGLPDGFLNEYDNAQVLRIIEIIRLTQPEILLINAPVDRHPDHGNSAKLELKASFLAGLRKIETTWEGEIQQAFRPAKVYHYIQDRYLVPDFVIDVTNEWETKMASIKAFRTQFYDPNSAEPATYISNPRFLESIEAKGKELGHSIGVQYGEGFIKVAAMGVNLLTDLIN